MSTTRQITTMPTSMGLPSRSLIFCLPLLWVMAFSEIFLPAAESFLRTPSSALAVTAEGEGAASAAAPAGRALGFTPTQKGLTK